jgi:TonB-linked SusC/RagA family outer membrane protein
MQFSFAQEKTVSGVVSDAQGPLPGANVVIKGTTKGVSTDIDGKYSIKAKAGDVLVFSLIGMADKSVTVGASNSYNVKMAESAEVLSEVLITGALGIKRTKDEVTSSQQVVKASEISQAGAPTIAQGLVGKVSGLQIISTNNSVNSSPRIVINGLRSITGNNQALVVVDNVISSIGVLNSIPPDLIENVNVLKGAQGSALYGEQGVNGVIIVTTKRGGVKGDKVSVTFNSSIDFQDVAYLPVRQTRYGQGWFGEHIAIENGSWGAQMDGSIQPVGLPQADGSFISAPYSPIKDNIGQFFQTGTIFQNGVSISAGSPKEGYALLSLSRQDREFVVDGDQFKRTNFLFKAGKEIGKWSVEGNVQYFNQSQGTTSAGLYSQLLQTATNIPVDRFANSGINGHWNVYYASPYWTRENVRNNSNTDFFSGIGTVKYQFNKNISASWVAGTQVSAGGATSYNNGWKASQDIYNALSNRIVQSNFSDSASMSRRLYSDFLINLDYMLTDAISFKANIGTNIQDNFSETNQVGGIELDVDGFYNFLNVLQPSPARNLSNNYFRDRRTANFANLDFGYKDYLFLNLTGRYDGTSVLNADNRNFFYPSAGVSFIPTKAFESIKSDVFNYAKINVGIVRSGNSSAVGTYAIDQVGVVPPGFPFGTLSSYVINQSPTLENIRPEFVTTKEIGLALGFFKDRLTFEGQYYVANTTDMITTATTSSASGIRSGQGNIGELENTGFNLDLGVTPIKTDNFSWNTRVNFSSAKIIVNKVSDDAKEVNLQQGGLYGIFAVEGEEFPTIKGIGYLRDPNGNVIIDEATGNPQYTSEFIKLGKATPDFILGFTNTFSYKGLNFTAVCDYRTGHQFVSGVREQLAWTGNLIESAENGRNGGFIFPNSVIQTAPGVFTPNTSVVTGGTNYESYQTYFSNDHSFNNAENNVLDATAFKVRELALSYSLPNKLIERAGITALSIGVNARNPFMILPKENRNYNDPETSNTAGNAQGIAVTGQYPFTRTFGFTLNVKF